MKYYIKEAREAAGYSQKQLAEMCGVAPSTFNGYETGVFDSRHLHQYKNGLIPRFLGFKPFFRVFARNYYA